VIYLDNNTNIDKITLEVLRNSFSSLVDEMGVTLSRSALSLIITVGKDYSGAVLTKEGDLVKQGIEEGLPAHVGTIPFTTKHILDYYKDDISEGDILITNDPYVGTHLPDIRMVKPIFWDNEYVANLVLCCHWADVGGSMPGSFVCNALDSMTEGLAIPPIKLIEKGKLRKEIERLILRNIRLPEMARGDIRATTAALSTGEKRFHNIIKKYGVDTVKNMFTTHIEENEKNFRQIINNFPDGQYDWIDYIDKDPGIENSEEPIKVELNLTINGDQVTYDYSKSGDQAKGGINCGIAATWSAIIVATKSLFPEIDMCHGINNAINVITRKGSIIDAQWPAPTCGCGSCSYQKVFDTVLGSYSKIIPDTIMAAGACETNFILSGKDNRINSSDYIMYCWTEGGYGALKNVDNHCFISMYASGSKNQCVEAFEQAYPVLWERFELIPDSGGAGESRGGLGTIRRHRLINSDGVISSVGDREKFPTWGLYGGGYGLNQGFIINSNTPKENNVGVFVTGYKVKEGDFWHFWSGGGGGYGNPLDRDVNKVLEDVLDGYVTIEGAEKDYGVIIEIIDKNKLLYKINQSKTSSIRKKMKKPVKPRKKYVCYNNSIEWTK